MTTTRVLLADDHALVRRAFARLWKRCPGSRWWPKPETGTKPWN